MTHQPHLVYYQKSEIINYAKIQWETTLKKNSKEKSVVRPTLSQLNQRHLKNVTQEGRQSSSPEKARVPCQVKISLKHARVNYREPPNARLSFLPLSLALIRSAHASSTIKTRARALITMDARGAFCSFLLPAAYLWRLCRRTERFIKFLIQRHLRQLLKFWRLCERSIAVFSVHNN